MDLPASSTAGLPPGKFRDPTFTRNGEPRARVRLSALETLWFNTGTLCNLTCQSCYIESSPRNDRLAYLTAADLLVFLDEIARDRWPTRAIGFTGGEPFMNPELPAMLAQTLSRGFATLVLTNAMKPMHKRERDLCDLRDRFGDRLTLRVSVDHYTPEIHEAERGQRSWSPTIEGLVWLVRQGFSVHVAGRHLTKEPEPELRDGFAALFRSLDLPIDARDPVRLMLFPEMDESCDIPEITDACWNILGRSPESVMCATSRMVVKRRDAERPSVVACTLLPYDERFELGATLAEADQEVALNHPHCASFCVLAGAACSR
jgi:hypothetical protein